MWRALCLIALHSFLWKTLVYGQPKEAQSIVKAFVAGMDERTSLCKTYCNEDWFNYLEEEYQRQITPPTTIEEEWNDELLLEGISISYNVAQQQLQKNKNARIPIRISNSSSKTTKGNYILSKPIFSLDQQTAIVWVSFKGGSLCASASLYFYKKTDKGWVFYKERILYLS
ncbi:MAG: hypothetical protein ACRBFS_07820 [Aureispira sp.]